MRCAWLLAVSACSFGGSSVPSDTRGSDGPQPIDAALDGPPDVPPDAPQMCFTALGQTICLTTPPTGTVDVTASNQLDTSNGTTTSTVPGLLCAPSDTPTVCAVAATTITIDAGATLLAKGAKPLVLIAAGTLTIAGTLDVNGTDSGAGAKPPSAMCDHGTNPPGGKSGGGQGGSFGTTGGAGGNGSLMNNSGGLAGAQFTTLSVRGGCPGADGEGSNMSSGLGGGVAVLFGDTISVGGSIDASGAAGLGGKKNKGGGGGGSGGLLVLTAQTITVGGAIFANGGGGGGGGNNAGTANTGGDGHPSSSPTNRPAGGTGASGNDGGDGFFQPAASPVPATPGAPALAGQDGGGGGGGGGGVIKLIGTTTVTGAISPPPS